MGKDARWTEDELVARARSAIGHATAYSIGCGGFHPADALPYGDDRERRCDCTGFLAWWLHVPRHLDHPFYRRVNGGWLESTAIVADARSPFGFFAEVPWVEARPGMVLAYGDQIDPTTKKAIAQGHVGVVVTVDRTGPVRVVHCSKGNWRRSGGLEVPMNAHADAIAETAAVGFQASGAIVARYAEVVHGAGPS